VAVALLLPHALVRARNAARATGIVPAAVVERQLAAAADLGGDAAGVAARLRAEGFASVRVVMTSKELDALSIERRPPFPHGRRPG
jgi:hypothetical protein